MAWPLTTRGCAFTTYSTSPWYTHNVHPCLHNHHMQREPQRGSSPAISRAIGTPCCSPSPVPETSSSMDVDMTGEGMSPAGGQAMSSQEEALADLERLQDVSQLTLATPTYTRMRSHRATPCTLLKLARWKSRRDGGLVTILLLQRFICALTPDRSTI
jgi:hypothetical protein